MKIFKIRKGDYVDEFLKYKFIPSVREHIVEKDDDGLYILIGNRGTGKSTLGLHILDQYLQNNLSVQLVAFDKESVANTLKIVSTMDNPKGWLNDEANINKRDAMSKYNKDLLDLYLAIRGMNILHLWCNPILDMIDKPFIESRMIKGIFLTTSKNKGQRPYFFINRKNVVRIFQKYGNLKLDTLLKVRRKYAEYRGAYVDYTGKLREAYKRKKTQRMSEKIKLFSEAYGSSDWVLTTEIKNKFEVSNRTVREWLYKAIKDKVVEEGVDYRKTLAGTYRIHINAIQKLTKYSSLNRVSIKDYANAK